MKIKKNKDGVIKMTAENKKDSEYLRAFLIKCAGDNSSFAKLKTDDNITKKQEEKK
jgi:L-2-hydroxyglutarate oxidase LhgO